MADTWTYGSKYICIRREDGRYDRLAETIHGDSPEWNAKAGFLIKAANSHDALVEALQRIAKRATHDADDTDADRKRDLYHILAIAEGALTLVPPQKRLENEMCEFQVGDVVRRVKQSLRSDAYGVVGLEYTISGFSFNGGLLLAGLKGNGSKPEDFVLVYRSHIADAKALLEEKGFTVTPPKPKLTGQVIVYRNKKNGDISITGNAHYPREYWDEIAIVDWTEGDGLPDDHCSRTRD